MILVHGLEGSSESRYIKGIAARAWAAGCNVVRMNMRNCGDTDELTPTLYHSGLSSDVGMVMRHYAERFGLERVALVGYSMGGNLCSSWLANGEAIPRRCARLQRFVRPSISLQVRTLCMSRQIDFTNGIFCEG